MGVIGIGGGKLVGIGTHLCLAGDGCPYTQSSSLSSSAVSSPSHCSTYTVTPTPSSGSSNISRLDRRLCTCNFRNAAMRSSARGVGLGGSSLIGSQPTGGEPGGEIRKFFS